MNSTGDATKIGMIDGVEIPMRDRMRVSSFEFSIRRRSCRESNKSEGVADRVYLAYTTWT